MISRERLLLAASLVVLSACRGGSAPATTPTTAPTAPTTSIASVTTVTTSPVSTTTTMLDRVAEIEAILQDLEQRRLTALYEGDREAFAALFANEAYLERDLKSFDLATFDRPPMVTVSVLEIEADGPECIAARVEYQGAVTGQSTVVVQPLGSAWGLAYVGEGWECVGPHPLSP